MALRNFNLYKEYVKAKVGKPINRLDIAGLFFVPLFCFFGGSLNLYMAAGIIKTY